MNVKLLDPESEIIIKDLSIDELLPNVIDGVVIVSDNSSVIARVPIDFASDRYKKWKLGKGGIFLNDCKLHFKGNACGKYLLMSKGTTRHIIRIIEEGEDYKMVDGKINDFYYMIVRTLDEGDNITSSVIKYIKENSIDLEIDLTHNISSESEDNYLNQNIALFED